MPSVTYRYDYLKLIITHPAGTFNQYYDAIRREGTRVAGSAEKWDRSHKVTAFNSMEPLWERTCVEVWGEASDLISALDWAVYSQFAKRLDVRAILWEVEEDAVLFTGQRLQRNVSSLNVECFSSKPASKRLGRDRGGKGFRVGSRKSDICAVVYKRTREPAAQEFRFQGQSLSNAIHQVDGDLLHKAEVLNLWSILKGRLQMKGEQRLERAMNEAGIGVYWPMFDHATADQSEGLQKSFVTYAQTMDAEDHAAFNWAVEQDQNHQADEDQSIIDP